MGQQPRKSLGSSRTAGNWEHCACCRCLVGGVRQAGRCTRLTVLLHGGEPACMRQTRSHCTRGEWAGLPRTLAVRRCLAGRWWVTGGQTCLCCCTLRVWAAAGRSVQRVCPGATAEQGARLAQVHLCFACRGCLAQPIMPRRLGRNVGGARRAAPAIWCLAPFTHGPCLLPACAEQRAAPGAGSTAQDYRDTDPPAVAASDWAARHNGHRDGEASLSIAAGDRGALLAGYPSLFSASWWRNGPSLCALGPPSRNLDNPRSGIGLVCKISDLVRSQLPIPISQPTPPSPKLPTPTQAQHAVVSRQHSPPPGGDRCPAPPGPLQRQQCPLPPGLPVQSHQQQLPEWYRPVGGSWLGSRAVAAAW